MAKAAAFFILLFSFCATPTQAQLLIEGGLSVGFNRHTFSINEKYGTLQPGIALTSTYGIPVVIKKDKWELHTGFYTNNLSQSFYFKSINGTNYGKNAFSSGISSFKIPLHIGRTLQWTRVTSLSPQIGIAWLTNQRTGRIGHGSGFFGNNVTYQSKSRAESKNKFLAEAGLDINFVLFNNLSLIVGTHYSLGLQPMEKVDLTYQINDNTYQGIMISKGSGWKFNLGLKIPLYSH